MKHIYIDVRHSFEVSDKSGIFNGGNNYTKRIVNILLQNANERYVPVLICSENVFEYIKSELEIHNEVGTVNNISEIVATSGDVYYSPLLDDSMCFAKEINAFRHDNPNVQIYLTIHDRRHMDSWYDIYDGILKSGIKRNSLILALGRMLHSFQIEKSIRKSIKVSDKIFTVSNYSMQKLNKYNNVKSINWFYQGIYGYCEKTSQKDEGFLLFVSAGRPEKNLIRTLYAFEQYVVETGSSVRLMCTGISENKKIQLKRKLKLNSQIFDNQVVFLDYVSADQLEQLYLKCKFLVFTSKSEGFGLPVLEAILREKPVLASNRSSIPEVAGPVAVYVNPFDVTSIKSGIRLLMQDEFYKSRVRWVKEKKQILLKQIDLDTNVLIQEIIG